MSDKPQINVSTGLGCAGRQGMEMRDEAQTNN